MINKDRSNPSSPSFLMNLNLAIREQQDSASRAKSKTGTSIGKYISMGSLARCAYAKVEPQFGQDTLANTGCG